MVLTKVCRVPAFEPLPPSEHQQARPAQPAGGGSAEMPPGQPPTERDLEPRLTVKPHAALDRRVDGAWWPRSADAVAEFPGLVMALSSWVGPVTRVACHFDAWNLAVTKLVANGWPVVLADDPALAANTVMVTGADDRHLTMLVIPPSTPGTAARAMLRIAAARATVLTADEILRSNGIPA